MTTLTQPAARTAGASRSPSRDFRPDIQGLRALAVGLVVLFHLWPNRLPGGYVGVDVFFVISGYLITAHMYREVRSTGSLGLVRFWARRVRRLLPAAFLVLTVSLVAVLVWVPSTLWTPTARQVLASAVYAQNWVLVHDSVTYMAKGDPPTSVEHYWSLSVEEQFYLVWPLLVVSILLVGRLLRRGGSAVTPGRALLVGLATLSTASLVHSVLATRSDPETAYFSTFTRAWEFGAGALLALLSAGGCRLPRPLATVAGWVGIAVVVGSAFGLDSASFFPGWVALFPVLGTVLVMATSEHGGRWSCGRLLSYRPATYVGDVSYSVYLWHWPLVVLVPYVTGVGLRTGDKLAILVATLALSAISKVLVEDRFRRGRLLSGAPWRAFVLAAAGVLVLAVATTAVRHEVDRRANATDAAASALLRGEARTGCLGPAALDAGNHCDPVSGDGAFVPSLEAVSQQSSHGSYASCQTPLGSRTVRTCTLGARSHPRGDVAVVGDSHAGMWLPAFDQLGADQRWAVHTYAKSSCPLTSAARVLAVEKTTAEQENCQAWFDDVLASLLDDPDITTVFTTAFSSAYEWESRPGAPLRNPRVDGFTDVWRRLVDAGKTVVVLRDVPATIGTDVPTCLATHRRRDACAVPRDQALRPDAIADAASAWSGRGVELVDLTDRFCDRQRCYPVVGNAVAYMDWSHLSTTYSRALAPYLEDQVERLQRP